MNPDNSIKLINKNILEIIRKNLKVKEREKKLFGEVFTPVELICDMLDKLPKNVWSDPLLKWLDPANGIGNFPIVVFYKLMEGLKLKIPNKAERSKHIIENMLYMIELNPVNCKVCRKIFKMINRTAKPNIIQADFIKEFNKKIYFSDKTVRFDIIMGNPPYNKGGVGKGGGVFWIPFVYKSLDLLNDRGFLTLVHPLGWRKPFKDGDRRNNAGRVLHTFKKIGNLLYVSITDNKIANFPKVDYYLFQKKLKPNRDFKTIVDNHFKNIYFSGKIVLNELNFIPNLVSNLSLSILKKLFVNRGQKFNIIRDQKFKPVKAQIGEKGIPHTFYYNPSKSTYVIVGKYMEIIPEYYSSPKLIMTYSNGKKKSHLYCKYYEDILGSTANTMYQIIDRKIGKKIEIFLNSKIIRFLLKIIQFSESPNHKNEFKILNFISIPEELPDNPTDQDIYEYYNLTPQEITLIEEIIKENTTKKKRRSKNDIAYSHTTNVLANFEI